MLKERKKALEAAFRSNDCGYELISASAYFSYVRHPFDRLSAKQVARKLADEQNVLCLPGSFFGPDQERFAPGFCQRRSRRHA